MFGPNEANKYVKAKAKGVMTREPVAFCLPFCRRQECSAENV